MKYFCLIFCAALLPSTSALAAIAYNTPITGNILFGSGVANGGFTVDQDAADGIELGVRAKTRFPQALNDFPNDGAGDYGGFPAGGFGPGFTNPSWSFDWSINSNFNGSGSVLSAYTYLLRLDADPSPGTNFAVSYDPINFTSTPVPDNSFGNNTTTNPGFSSNTLAGYQALTNTYNLGQNSYRYSFFPQLAAAGFDFNSPGIYTIDLQAFKNGALVADSSINVFVGPEPSSAISLATGLAGLAFLVWRKRGLAGRRG